jgi:hypothetical protein
VPTVSPATHWLAEAAEDPRTVMELWRTGNTAPLAIGLKWDLVGLDFTVATAAITHLKAHGRHIGPYLMGGAEHSVWLLLPLGSGRRFRSAPPYAKSLWIFAPPPGRYLGDRVWVLPDQAGDRWNTLTSPDDLREALDAR